MSGLRVHVAGGTFTEPSVLKAELDGGTYGDSWPLTTDGGSVRASAIIASIGHLNRGPPKKDLARAERRRTIEEAMAWRSAEGRSGGDDPLD